MVLPDVVVSTSSCATGGGDLREDSSLSSAVTSQASQMLQKKSTTSQQPFSSGSKTSCFRIDQQRNRIASPESAAFKPSPPLDDSPVSDIAMRVGRTSDDVDNGKPHSKPILKPHGRRHLVSTSDHKLSPPLRAVGKRVSFVEPDSSPPTSPQPDSSPPASAQPDNSPLATLQQQRKYYS